MEPFALLKMMGIFVTGGITGRIVLYLLLLAAGVGVRCALQRRRDFRTAAGISAGHQRRAVARVRDHRGHRLGA